MKVGWQLASLGDLVEIRSGLVDPRDPDYSALPHVGSDSIESASGRLFGVEMAAEVGVSSGKFLFSEGDVLYSKIRPYLNKVTIAPYRGICSADIYVVVPMTDLLDARYLVAVLRQPSFLAYANAHSARTNIPKINREAFASYSLPLPPIEEQRRIAAILDKADAIRRKRQEALELTEQLLRSTFLDMFGDPVSNPKGWPVVPIGNVISTIEAGWSASGEARACSDGEWGVLKVSAVSTGRYRPCENKFVMSIDEGKPLIVPVRGDLLFSRANTRELVGAACLVEQECPYVFLPDKLWRVRTTAEACVEFLCVLLQQPAIQESVARLATGTSGSMLNISQEKMRTMSVIMPALDSQKLFAEAFWNLSRCRSKSTKAAADAEALYQSLAHRAFTGQL